MEAALQQYLPSFAGEHTKWKLIKSRDAVVQKYRSSFDEQGASQSGEPLHGDGIPNKPRDVWHLTKVRDKHAQDILKM
jgi:hypothetical protein